MYQLKAMFTDELNCMCDEQTLYWQLMIIHVSWSSITYETKAL